MLVCTIMIGIPASGKSTYAARIGDRIVSSDVIREKTGAPSVGVFAKAHRQLVDGLRGGEDIVFDALNLWSVFRGQSLQTVRPFADWIVGVVMDTPLELCLNRHRARVQQGIRTTLSIARIGEYHRAFATCFPKTSEGFDEIVRITPERE